MANVYNFIQGVPEKSARDKFGTVHRKMRIFYTKMFSKD